MNINIKTILIVVLIIFAINTFNKKSKKNEDFTINCNFEKFSDDATSSVLDVLSIEKTESIPESDNSENLKTIDQVNFESNYDISNDSENSDD